MASVRQLVAGYWAAQQDKAQHSLGVPRLTDLRLLLPALLLWAFTACWILGGNQAALFFLLALALVLFLFYGLGVQRFPGARHLLYLLLFSLVLLCCQVSLLGMSGQARDWEWLQNQQGQLVRLEGRLLDARPAGEDSYLLSLSGRLETAGGEAGPGELRIQTYSRQDFQVGSLLAASGQLEVRGTSYRLKGKTWLVEAPDRLDSLAQLRQQTRTYALERVSGDATGLLLGMSYGDDSSLTTETSQALKVAGLTHLTAVSGANISLVFVLVYRSLYRLLPRPRLLVLLGSLASCLYAALVGPDPSVLRALVMGLLGGLALVAGRGRFSSSLLSLTVLFLLLLEPNLALQYGFILSLVATAALIYLAPSLSQLFRPFLPIGLSDLLAVPLATSLWTAPALLVLTQAFYPYTVLANLLVVPLLAPITFCGLAFLLASALGLPDFLLELPLGTGAFCAHLLAETARAISQLPASDLPLEANALNLALSLLLVVALSSVVFYLEARRSPFRKLRLVASPLYLLPRQGHRSLTPSSRVLLLVFLMICSAVSGRQLLLGHLSSQAPEDWVWISCDVGQGDAHLVRTGPQQAILLDTGEEGGKLEDCLRWGQVKELQALILTHDHQDHDGLAAPLIQAGRIQQVYTSPHYRDERLGRNSLQVQQLETGDLLKVSEQVQGQVLWPPAGSESVPGEGNSKINNGSLVIRWVLTSSQGQELSILTTGDLEADAADLLVASAGQQLSSQVLKLAHHGSRGSGQEQIRAANPSLALVSVGEGNSFGHPHPQILSYLEQEGIPLLRTDQLGHLALASRQEGQLELATSRGG